METLTPPWNICVVTHTTPDLSSAGGDFSNALLYGDNALWIPDDFPFQMHITESEMLALVRRTVKMVTDNPDYHLQGMEALIKESMVHQQRFIEAISAQGLPIVTPKDLINKGLEEDVDNPQFGVKLRAELDNMFLEYQRSAQACIVDSRSSYALLMPSSWDAHRAAQLLMQALSRVLLPDVANLPLPEIASLKEKVKSELDPMRAELLRLTKDLRRMVVDGCSEEEVVREAENLIKTHVEPVVREAAAHVDAEMRRRLRRFLKGGLKFFGLAGLGFLDPKLTGAALKQGVEVMTQGVDVMSQVRPSTATAHLVLELRRNMSKV